MARGTRLFTAGQPPAWLYFVNHGELQLERAGDDGSRIVLQRVSEGLIAEASLNAGHYHCDGVAALESSITQIPLGQVRSALRDDPSFAMRWIAMLAGEVVRLRARCERLAMKTVQARLLHLIDAEGGPAGFVVRSGLKSVAAEIGVSHEALYRCVAALERQGLIRREDDRIRRLGADAPSARR